MNPPEWFLELQKYIFVIVFILFIIGSAITARKQSMKFITLAKPYLITLMVISLPLIVMFLLKSPQG